jgi:hypothetical protein
MLNRLLFQFYDLFSFYSSISSLTLFSRYPFSTTTSIYSITTKRLNSSLFRALVSLSIIISLLCIYANFNYPFRSLSLIQRYRISRYRFLPTNCGLFANVIVFAKSLNIVGIYSRAPTPSKSLWIYNTSLPASMRLRYSASIVLKVTIDYLFDYHFTRPLLTNTIYPLVDFLIIWQSPNTTSLYTIALRSTNNLISGPPKVSPSLIIFVIYLQSLFSYF